MAEDSIYRPLRENGQEIRVLRMEPSLDSSDNLLKYKLHHISLQDSVPAVERTDLCKTQENDFGKHSHNASELIGAKSSEAALEAQRMCHVTDLCKQRKRKFDEETSCNHFLPYLALSYTWGDPQDTVPIQVEGTVMMVSRNLRDALVAIRAEPQTSSFSVWADAVCINQGDTKERSQEVKKMAEVYRRASRVVIWLGHVPPTWNFFGLTTIGEINNILPRLLMKGKGMGSEIIHPDEYTRDDILTLVAILDRPYWTRIWILQELVMADYDNTFFFWAGTFRHVSDLQHAQQIFDSVVSTWLQSPEISSLFNNVSTSEDNAMRIRHPTQNSGNRSNGVDSRDEEAQMAMQNMISRMKTSDFASEISEFLEDISTKNSFDTEAYVQRNFKGEASPDFDKIGRMVHGLKELASDLECRNNDSYHRMKRSEIRLALNELSITVATIIGVATVNTAKEETEFRILMTHSLRGQCTNTKDLVYGLLGLQRHEIVSQITPDYDLSIERVLSNFSAAVIRYRGINFLCEYGSSLSDASSNLPSWVVDLTKGLSANPARTGLLGEWKKFSAGGARNDDIRFSVNDDRMYCQGLLYKVDMKTPQPMYGNKDSIRLALERVVSHYAPEDGTLRSMLNISTQTTSKDFEVAGVVEMVQDFWMWHTDFAVEGIGLESLFPDRDDILEWDLETAYNAVSEVLSMKLFTTTNGMIGCGAKTLRDGDSIGILRGCNLPMILRARGVGYELIGMCYLDGAMFGELVREDSTWEELTIL